MQTLLQFTWKPVSRLPYRHSSDMQFQLMMVFVWRLRACCSNCLFMEYFIISFYGLASCLWTKVQHFKYDRQLSCNRQHMWRFFVQRLIPLVGTGAEVWRGYLPYFLYRLRIGSQPLNPLFILVKNNGQWLARCKKSFNLVGVGQWRETVHILG